MPLPKKINILLIFAVVYSCIVSDFFYFALANYRHRDIEESK